MLRILWAVAATDLRNRWRRRSFLLLLGLVMLATVYFLPPADATYATLSINGLRGVYTSGYVGAVAGTLAAFLIGLVGFMTGGAISDDERTGMAELVGTYPVPRGIYLWGKTAGHLAFLLVLVAASFVSAALVQWYRAEAPLEPAILAGYYLAFPVTLAVVVAGWAALSDVLRPLWGVGGTVLFLVLYLTFIGVGTALAPAGRSGWDPTGMAPTAFAMVRALIDQGKVDFSSVDVVIGNPGRPATAAIWWNEPASRPGRLPWVAAGLLAGCLAAWLYRGHPIRGVKPGASRKHSATASRLGGALLYAIRFRVRLPAWIWADAIALLAEFPWFPSVVLLPVVAAVLPPEYAARVTAPLAFLLAIGPVVRTVSRQREERVDTLLAAAPGVQRHFTEWKLASCALIALTPIMPTALVLGVRFNNPVIVPVMALGALQLVALSVALGAFSASSRALIGVNALLWYVNALDRAPAAVDWMGLQPSGPRLTPAAVGLTLAVLASDLAWSLVAPRLRRGAHAAL